VRELNLNMCRARKLNCIAVFLHSPSLAEAMLDARKVVVEGAVEIANDAIDRLKLKGITMQPQEANTLVSNLIVTICSESRVTPTINLSSAQSTYPKVY
jgi:hypothetical protein